MKNISLVKGVFAASLTIACFGGLAGCAAPAEPEGSAVAATVNGTEIAEDRITKVIEDMRTQQSLTDEDSWGNWLVQNGYTPESAREEILESYINEELLRQNAGDLGVTVDSATIDSYVDQMKGNYSTDEEWQNALSQVGITEDDYRSNIELSLLYQGVMENLSSGSSDEDALAYARENIASYDGAKKSSHILFDAADEATAQSVLDQINAGTLDFAAAAEQYSKDTGSAADGGNVGWDKLTTFVTEYQDALDQLSAGQVSGLVTSTYGIHVIKCTEEFTAPAELTSLDQIPAEITEDMSSKSGQSAQTQAYTDWLAECRDKADIVINDIPADVSYNVDMSKYSDDSSSADTSAGDGEAPAEGDAGETADGADAPAEEGADANGEGDAVGDGADTAAGDGEADAQ